MTELKDFEKWFQKLNKSNLLNVFGKSDDEDNYMEFVWALMKSPYVEYHYSLMVSKGVKNKGFQQALWSRFDEHGENAASLLLAKLEKQEDIDYHPEIIFLLGKMANRKGCFYKDQVLDYARQYSASPDTYLRDRAIIVLGWIGGSNDVTLLSDRLLNDPDSKCRAWAATSFMHIWFGRKSSAFVEKVLPHLYKAIQQETDDFTLGCIITVVQELTQKKFGLSQKSVDNTDKEKINIAKLKALRFFDKKYSEHNKIS